METPKAVKKIQGQKDGGIDQAEDDFEEITGGDYEVKPNGTKIGQSKDGREVGFYNNTGGVGKKDGGKPTISINNGDGTQNIIRYDK